MRARVSWFSHEKSDHRDDCAAAASRGTHHLSVPLDSVLTATAPAARSASPITATTERRVRRRTRTACRAVDVGEELDGRAARPLHRCEAALPAPSRPPRWWRRSWRRARRRAAAGRGGNIPRSAITTRSLEAERQAARRHPPAEERADQVVVAARRRRGCPPGRPRRSRRSRRRCSSRSPRASVGSICRWASPPACGCSARNRRSWYSPRPAADRLADVRTRAEDAGIAPARVAAARTACRRCGGPRRPAGRGQLDDGLVARNLLVGLVERDEALGDGAAVVGADRVVACRAGPWFQPDRGKSANWSRVTLVLVASSSTSTVIDLDLVASTSYWYSREAFLWRWSACHRLDLIVEYFGRALRWRRDDARQGTVRS